MHYYKKIKDGGRVSLISSTSPQIDKSLIKIEDEQEYDTLRAAREKPTAEEIAAQEKEALIQAKIREMAEAELIAEGKLT